MRKAKQCPECGSTNLLSVDVPTHTKKRGRPRLHTEVTCQDCHAAVTHKVKWPQTLKKSQQDPVVPWAHSPADVSSLITEE